MTWLKILAVMLIVLALIGQIRLGGAVCYNSGGLYVHLWFGKFRFQLYPVKKQKKEKPPKEKQAKAEEAAEEKGGSVELAKRYLPLACEAAGELKRKIRIDHLDIFFTAASADAADAALAFGYANIALGMLWPLFEQNFQVKEHDLRTSVDFDSDRPTVYVYGALSLKVGQLLGFLFRYGWKALKIYMETKKVQTGPIKKQKEAI